MPAPTLSDDRSAAALFRLVAAGGTPAVGVFATDGDACRLVAGNPALLDLLATPASPLAPPPLDPARPRRIDPAALGLAAGFAAAVPLAGRAGGFLVAAAARPRRLTPALALRLADAALLAAPLLARAARPLPAGGAPLRAAIRPRARRAAPGRGRHARRRHRPPGRADASSTSTASTPSTRRSASPPATRFSRSPAPACSRRSTPETS